MNPVCFRKRSVGSPQPLGSPPPPVSNIPQKPSSGGKSPVGDGSFPRYGSEATLTSTSSNYPAGRGRLPQALPKLKGSKASHLLHGTASAPNLRDGQQFKFLGAPPAHLVALLRGVNGSTTSAVQRDVMGSPTGSAAGNAPSLGQTARSDNAAGKPRDLPALDFSSRKGPGQSSRPGSSGGTAHEAQVTWSTDGKQVAVGEASGETLPSESVTWSARVEEYAHEVSSVARKINKDLQKVDKLSAQQAEARLVEHETQKRITFFDPVLQRAKEVSAEASQSADTPAETDEECHSLKKIAAVTRKVHDSLKELLEDSWVSTALSKPIPESDDEEEMEEEDEQQDDEQDRPQTAGEETKISKSTVVMSKGGVVIPEVPGLASLAERLARISSDEEMSKDEAARILVAFNRFKVAGGGDLHKDALCGLLEYMGHVMIKGEGLWDLYNETTPYDYVDFDEFLCFMEKYIPYEREEMKRVYDEFDEDGSGEMSVAELRTLTAYLGITPLRGMMNEALNIVDVDGNGQLDFLEFCAFLVVYRHCEGFTRAEVANLLKAFDRLKGDDGRIAAGSLVDGLVRCFGIQLEAAAEDIVEEIRNSPAADGNEPEALMFGEFLIFCRRSREAQQRALDEQHGSAFKQVNAGDTAAKGEFDTHDLDGSGGISKIELCAAIRQMGFEPLYAVIDEVFSEVIDERWNEGRELDFNEFFDFLLIYRQRDGFLLREVEELEVVFNKFDVSEGDEEISALELADIFRYLGYAPSSEDVFMMVAKVDVNGSNALDIREFTLLMQMHRKKEILKMRAAFDGEERNGIVLEGGLLSAAEKLDQELSDEMLKEIPKAGVDFEVFVQMMDGCRAGWVTRQRKKAGYSDQEIEHYQDMFNKYDKDRGGSIDNMELQKILQEFGWEPKSREEQLELLSRLDQSRVLALEAGVEETSESDSGEITFWEFVQLCRISQKQQEADEEIKMKKLMVDLKYTQMEIDQFRQVFIMCSKNLEDPDDPNFQEEEEGAQGGAAKGPTLVGRDNVRKLIRQLGVRFSNELMAQLDAKLKTYEDSSQRLAFHPFLYIMKWLVDTDFGSVNAAALAKKKGAKEKADASKSSAAAAD